MVEFMWPDGEYPMVPDKEDDEMKAMAMVNTKMMVSSNMVAAITPMWLVEEGASPVGVMPGTDNMPFQYVDWGALQSHVLSMGATFEIRKASIGANQEMMPMGDAVYITCGPFECAKGDMAPEISIANSPACTAWHESVSIDIEVGKVDNDVLSSGTGADAISGVNDGIDLGIVTSSSLPIKMKHVFSGVANGRNTSISVDAAKGSDKVLAMKGGADGHITVNAAADVSDTEGINESMVCDNDYDAGDLTDRPGSEANCFRLRGPGAGKSGDASKGPDYLSGWTIEMTPDGGAVSWGMVEWEEDPFEDLTCGAADPVMVADHVDVCAMFDAEVDLATGKGWKPTVVFGTDNRVRMWKATASPATGTKMFETIWFDDNLNGKILKDTAAERPDPDGDGEGTAAGAAATIHDLRDAADRDNNINAIWEFLTDADGDLTAGDLGKSDFVSATDNFKTADDERTIDVEACQPGVKWTATKGTEIPAGCDGTAATVVDPAARKTNPDGRADNYEEPDDDGNRVAIPNADDFYKCSEDDGGDADEGTACDAEWTNDVTVLFADGTFGCTTTRDVTVTCTWDADGGMAQGRNALPDEFDGNGEGSNLPHFLKCTAK